MSEYNISARLSLKDQMTAKLNSAIRAAERLSRGVGDAKDRDINYKIGVKGMEQLKRYQEMLKSAGMTQPKPVNLRVNDNGATSKINKIKTDLQAVTGRSWNAVLNIKTNGAAALGKVKSNLSELATGAAFGLGASMLGTAGVGYGAVNMVQSYMDYEKSVSEVQAVLGYQKEDMGALAEEAKRIGYTSRFKASEAAKAQYYMGLAGWREEQILAGGKNVVNLAAAGNMDLARSSDIVTDLMTAYGLKAGTQIGINGKPLQEASAFFVDSMAALMTSANTDMSQAYEAMKYSAPVVSAMYSNGTEEQKLKNRALAMQDAFVITGLMANAGVKGSMAGTSQRALYSRLASENRNAYFGERALGISFTDEQTGEVRRLRDVIGDFRKKFNEGLDVDQVTDFAEAISGEKIHADTRRKLNSFIENVQKNGGQMTGADKLKLTSMLAGQEAMSGWLSVLLASEEEWKNLEQQIENANGKAQQMADVQMDNLAGDITKLGSAWEVFNVNLMEGNAAGGLRDFTQGVTDFISKGIDALKDGFQVTDIFFMLGTAIDKLKNKFLEFDGIGSILAGGALFMGLKKIASLALSIKDTLGTWSKARTASDIGDLLRGNKTPPISSSQVGTMHVNAGVVNVNGATKGGAPAGQPNQRGGVPPVGTPATGGAAKTRSQQYADDYYKRRETILAQRGTAQPSTTVPPIIPPTTAGTAAAEGATRAGVSSVLRGAAGGIAGGGILAAVFGALDVYSAKSQSQISNDAATAEVIKQQKHLAELQSSANSTQEDILIAQQSYQDALTAQKEIAIQNTNAERKAEFGAGGMVAGAVAGGVAGSFVPVIGTMVGGIIGGILGQIAGDKAADKINAMSTNQGVSESKGNPDWYKDAQPTPQVGSFKQLDEQNLQAQQPYLQTIESAKAAPQRPSIGDFKRAEYEKPITETEMVDANLARENWIKDQQLKQQKVFGGRYVGEVQPYQPKEDDREQAALKAYDAKRENEMRLETAKRSEEVARATAAANKSWRDMEKPTFENAKTTFQAAEEFKAASSEYKSRQKAFSDAFTNSDGKGFIDSVGDFFSGIKKAALDYGDELLFSKAAAATPDSVTQPVQMEPVQTQPSEPSQGVFDFELPNIAEMLSNFELPDFGAKISEWFSSFELPEFGIAEKLQAEFDGAGMIFDNFVMTAQASFANLGAGIQGALEGARSAITTAFNDAATQVQATWSAVPGFFSGVFAGLGGVASSAGSAIYSGLTSVIGGIIGAWQSAASTISGIIASISAAAANAASAAGNFFGGGVGSNATGTASWKGGWTEVNEHGGEIINLPKGTQIIPHATTTKILRKEINQRLDNGEDNFHGLKFKDYGFMPDDNKINPLDVKLPRGIDVSSTPLSGDVIKPKIESSDGWRKNGNFSRDILGRIFQPGERAPLSGDVLYPRIDDGHIYGRKQNSTSTNLLESIFTGIFGRTPRQQSFKGLPSFSLPDIFNTFGSFDLPSLDFPSLPSTSNSTTNNSQSSSNTLNINGVTINNGANEDEIFFHFQKMFNLAMVNSEQV